MKKADSDALTPKLGVWNRDGEPQWATTLAQAGRNTVVSVHDDTIFAAWIQDETETTSSVWTSWWEHERRPAEHADEAGARRSNDLESQRRARRSR